MLESFMLQNQIIPVESEDGEIVEANLHNFLSDADYPSNGHKRPESWHDAVRALRNEMTTHAVITASAYLFHLEISILDWQGKIAITSPANMQPETKIYLGYTGDHYMLLSGKLEIVTVQISRKKAMTMTVEDWPEENDCYNPGVSVFRGIKYDLSGMRNPDTQKLFKSMKTLVLFRTLARVFRGLKVTATVRFDRPVRVKEVAVFIRVVFLVVIKEIQNYIL
ncbi:Hypothetical predicted protein [Paramuricea clavata]|uniref:Uncharacterized protein n=1 Tax=Paramuricea clavata TaxID=317549 RepID=A0A7D9DU65_PARCT|nr:Hypothetical predicted protein [Paramuricea clavata]